MFAHLPGPVNEVQGVMCFLSNNRLNIFLKLRVVQFIAVGAHDLYQESFKMWDIDSQGIEKNRKLGFALAPDGIVVLDGIEVESQLPNRNLLHRMCHMLVPVFFYLSLFAFITAE